MEQSKFYFEHFHFVYINCLIFIVQTYYFTRDSNFTLWNGVYVILSSYRNRVASKIFCMWLEALLCMLNVMVSPLKPFEK